MRLEKLKRATTALRRATTEQKNQVLLTLAKKIEASMPALMKANAKDLRALDHRAGAHKTPPAFVDRLTLNESRVQGMIEGLEQIARLPDPVGQVVDDRMLANGLRVKRVRAPLGVILVIYESRPNVAIDAFALAFKSGNVVLLKGGSEAKHTCQFLYKLMGEALEHCGFSGDVFWGFADADRSITKSLLKQTKFIDVVIPRGGEKLITFVEKEALMPVIKNDRGLCHVYIHEDADALMAERILINAKTQRPGVCNAMETLLVHEKAQSALAYCAPKLWQKGVKIHACPVSYKILKGLNPTVGLLVKASPRDFDTEYLALEMNCRTVKSFDEALAHIQSHGSRHSEAIITKDAALAHQFLAEVDASAVYWNASTRFTDGFELGLGAEIGISTQKLHVRGPVGLQELTSPYWVISGTGQIR